MGHCGAGMRGKKLLSFRYCLTINAIQVQHEKRVFLACTEACRNNVKSYDNTHNHLDKLEQFHSMFHWSDRNV